MVPSPFLPSGVQFAWDSTSLGYLKDCPRKYQLSMIEGWRPKGASIDLTFGLLYHQALELYDRLATAGCEDAIHQVVHSAMTASYGWRSDHTAKNRENLIRSIVWYFDEFASDPLQTIQLANGKPAVELSFRWELGFGPHNETQPYILAGHIDRLVDLHGQTFVTDRKTTGTTISPQYFSRFDIDNQMSLYILSSQVIWHVKISGVIIDAAQIAVGFTRFARGLTFRTPAQLQEWLGDLHYWLGQAEAFAKSGYWPMNDKHCFLCPFKSVCSKDPAARQQWLESDFEQAHWNPLEVR
jgi:hypothetical protein